MQLYWFTEKDSGIYKKHNGLYWVNYNAANNRIFLYGKIVSELRHCEFVFEKIIPEKKEEEKKPEEEKKEEQKTEE